MVKNSEAPKRSIWLQLYFVLASLLGLVCLVIGLSTGINTLLISTILKVETTRTFSPPPAPYIDPAVKSAMGSSPSAELNAKFQSWQDEYARWEKEQQLTDWETQERKRSLAWSIALLITGLPVFLLHAPMLFRSAKQL